MRYRPVFWALLSVAGILTLGAAPAEAGFDSWYFGGSFSVGGVHFRVGFAEVGPYGSSFYFEAGKPFYHRGHRCSTYCYRRGPRYYHHPSCPLVGYHFSLYGYAPGYFIEHYGPRLPYRPPPAYYHAPPRWNPHYYGYYGRHDYRYRDRYYDRKRYDRFRRDDRFRSDRHRGEQFRNDRDRRFRDDRRDRDRRSPRGNGRDRHNRGGIKRE